MKGQRLRKYIEKYIQTNISYRQYLYSVQYNRIYINYTHAHTHTL